MLFFIVAFSLLVVIPLVAILTEHQRKMVKMRLEAGSSNGRIEALERRVADLTELLHEQTIAIDSLGGRAHAGPEPLGQRIGR